MADYDTKAVKIGGVTVTVSKEVGTSAGDRVAALLKFIAKWAHAGKPPENGVDNTLPPPGRPVDPGYGQGTPGRPGVNPPLPDQGLPGGGKPPAGSGGTPGHPLPGDQPEISNDLPSWIANNVDEVVKAVLKSCVDCDTAKPHNR